MKRKLLFAIVALVCSVGSWAYQTPEADGIYYLYNTGCTSADSKGFLSTGCGYGFQAVIDNYGFPVKLIDAGNGNFQFQFIHHNGYLSDNGWMYSDGDTGRARTITIQDQGNGNYKLYNTNNSTWIETWWNGTLNGYGVVGDGSENRNNYIWQFLSKAERDAIVAGYTTSVKLAAATSMGMPNDVDTEAEFDSYLIANYIGIDQSSKIQNGTFDTSHNTTGWTTTANPNRNFNIGWGNIDPKTTPEVYEGAGSISQTVTVDKVGLYKVSVNATYRCGNAENNNRIGDLGYDGSVAYLKANDNFTKIDDWYSGKINGNGPGSPSEANSAYFANGKYLTEVFVYVGDAKTIDISLHSHAFTWGGWLMFNNFKLTYYSDEVSDEDATTILTNVASLAEEPMEGSVLSALNTAKNTFDGSRTIANYNALSTAMTNAQASATAYAGAAAYFAKMKGVLDNTNVYTEAAYDAKYGDWLAGYNARTLETAFASTLNESVAFSTGWHSDNNIDDILLSTWTIGATDPQQCANYDKALYINTWSVEGNTDGSDFHTPFFEYWVEASNQLAANTFTSTLTGLNANETYSVTIRARVQPQNNQTMLADAIQMQVGSGEPVTISSGTKFGTTNYYIGNFTAVGQADNNGTLVTTITVANDSKISWLSFYNLHYIQGEDLSAYIADYEFALSTAQADLANTAYANVTGKEKADLQTATTNYADGEVDETSKAALIAAKEALETASNTFVNAAATYNAFAELNATVATTLGVTLPTITSSTTAADLDIEEIIVDMYTAAAAYTYSVPLGGWTNAPGWNHGESWKDGNDNYYDEYNKAARAMTQTLTLPAGDYVVIAKGRASENGRLTLSDGTNTVTFAHKGASGKGIDTNGAATFANDATYTNNNNGRGWEYRVLTFTSDGSAPVTLTFNWTTANNNWVGLDDIELRASVDPVGDNKTLIADNKGDITSLINGDFTDNADGWTGGSRVTGLARGWNSASEANPFYEIGSSGTMSYTLHFMPAGTYKVVAASRTYNGGKMKAQVAGGEYGAEITGIGDARPDPEDGTPEINLNGVEMPYSSLGGFTTNANGHNWHWISATGTLAADGDLVINFVATGDGWMPIDDVHLECTSLDGTSYTVSANNISENTLINTNNGTNANREVLTCDITVTNPNVIIRTTGAKTTAAGQPLNNNQYSSSRITKLVLYDGYDFTNSGDDYGLDNGATLYRNIPADTWCTLVVPFYPNNLDVKKVPASLGANGVLSFEDAPTNDVNDAPMLVKSTAGVTAITGVRNSTSGIAKGNMTSGSDINMNGIYAAINTVPHDSYVVARVNDADALYKVDSDVSLAPFRAYFSIPTGSGVKANMIRLNFDDTETGIGTIENGQLTIDNAEIYNIAGQRVNKAQKGIYIMNGKKVLVK